MGLDFRVLGPVRASEDGVPLAVPAGKQRLLLGVLLARANRPVPLETIVETLWSDGGTPGSRASLHNHAMRLRRALGATAGARVRTSADAYLIDVAEAELDRSRFGVLRDGAQQAMAREDWRRARELLREALALWHGRAFEDLAAEGWLADEAARLEELRWLAAESWAEAEQRLDRHEEVIADLRALTQTHPLRERFHAQLMLSLHETGRTAEALEAYQRVRTALVDELGIEPGSVLRAAHRTVLGDASDVPDGAGEATLPVPRALPAGIADFTGRHEQVERLLALVPPTGSAAAAREAVVISSIGGMGGIGKTTLAVHVGHLVRGHFPDGQLFANLRGTAEERLDPYDVLGVFLRQLGYTSDAVPADPQERAGLYRSTLAERRTLVLLDNARDGDQIRPLIPGGPGNLVLVTGRGRLTGLEGAVHVDLDALSAESAHELFARIVGAELVAAEPEAVREVLEICAGLPLAVRLAGVRLATRPQWRVRDLAERLRSAEQRLDGFDLDGRGLRATFETGYAGLTEGDPGGPEPNPAARAFCLLGLCGGAELGLPAAAALLGLPAGPAELLLEKLVDLNLVQSPQPGRYGLHDLLLVYAAERAVLDLPPGEANAALNRLFTWYAKATDAAQRTLWPTRPAQEIGPVSGIPPIPRPSSAGEAVAWWSTEQANVVGSVHLARANGLTTLARQLAMAVWTFLRQQRDMRTWAAVLEVALESAIEEDDPVAEASVRNNLAIAHVEGGNSASALAHLEICAKLRREQGDLDRAGSALANLGIAAMETGQSERALSSLREALELWTLTGNQDGQAVAHTNIGEVLLRLGRPRETLAESLRARQLYQERDDPRLAEVMTTLSEAHLAVGDQAAARAEIEEAIRLHVHFCHPHGQARALAQYGHVLLAENDAEAARRAWLEAVEIFEELDPAAAGPVRALLDALPKPRN